MNPFEISLAVQKSNKDYEQYCAFNNLLKYKKFNLKQEKNKEIKERLKEEIKHLKISIKSFGFKTLNELC